MTARKHTALMLALAGAVTLPVFAAEKAEEEHAAHHPTEVQTNALPQAQVAALSVQERRQAMRQRMQEIRATQDPDKRRQLLEAQMKDIEALLDEGVCPQPGGGMIPETSVDHVQGVWKSGRLWFSGHGKESPDG